MQTRTKFLVGALLMSAFSTAHAIPTLRLTSSLGGDVTVQDGGIGDLADQAGVILFFGDLAGWSINITSGFSKPTLGSATQPILDLTSANISSWGGGGALDIWFTDTDFATITNAVSTMAGIGGTTSGSVSYRAYYDASNTPFGTANELADMSFSTFAFAGEGGNQLLSPDPFSMTLRVTINHSGYLPFQMSSFDAIVRVPEPSSLLLFGSGLLALGMGLVLRRRRMAQRNA